MSSSLRVLLLLPQIAARKAAEAEAQAKKEAEAAAAELAKAAEGKIKPRKSKKSSAVAVAAATGSAAKKGHTVGSTTGDAARDRLEATAKERRRGVLAKARSVIEKGLRQRKEHTEKLQRFESLSLTDNEEQQVSAPAEEEEEEEPAPVAAATEEEDRSSTAALNSEEPTADDKESSAAPLATLDAALESKDFTAICRALFKAGGSVDEKKRDEVRATLHAIREVSPLLSLLLPCLSVLCSLRSACGVIIGPSLPLGLPVASHPSPPRHLCPSFCMWRGILPSLAGVAGREVLPPRPPRTSRP